MNLFALPIEEFEALVLILIRVAAMLSVIPVLGNRSIPVMVKAGLSLAMAIMIFPAVRTHGLDIPEGNLALFVALLGEIGIGLFVGFLARLVFAAIQLAGQFIGYQMGFGIVNVLDPQTSEQLSIIALFENFIALLLFLSLNIHHLLLRSMAESFQLIPLLEGHYPVTLVSLLIQNSGEIFVLAIKVGAPVMAVLLFVNTSMGVIARTVPQMNVFIVAFPLQIGAGLIILGLSLPMGLDLIRHSFTTLGRDIISLLHTIQVG